MGATNKRYLGAIVLLLAAQSAAAQDWARAQLQKSPRHQEWVTVKHDGRSVETFVVYPESKDKRPVVLVIHEISRWRRICFREWDRMEGVARRSPKAKPWRR
jgi:hypothetical protein